MQKKKIEAELAEIDKDLKPTLTGRGPLVHAGFMHEVKPVKGRVTYDYKAMADDGIDLEPYKKEGAPSARYEIKQVADV